MPKQTPCPHCGQNIARYKSVFNHILLSAAIKAYRYGRNHNTDEVNVKQLNLTNSEYTRIAELVLFGFFCKDFDMKKGTFRISFTRIEKFIRGRTTVCAFIWRAPMKVDDTEPDHEPSAERLYIGEIPKIEVIREKYGDTFTEYEKT